MPLQKLINGSIIISNFKSYGNDGIVLSSFPPLNLVIGKNNAGKSALLDILSHLTTAGQIAENLYHNGIPTTLMYKTRIGESVAKNAFPEGTTGGHIHGGTWWNMAGRHLVDAEILVKIDNAGNSTRHTIDIPPAFPNNPQLEPQLNSIVTNTKLNTIGLRVIRLLADRDVSPEMEQESLFLNPNGSGLTNMLAQFITMAKYNSRPVMKKMINILNDIFFPEAKFLDIEVQKIDQTRWEIFLEEETKGLIALSNSGSGLKTALIVIAIFEMLPIINTIQSKSTLYLLEELENNLHPALQRKLLSYVAAQVKAGGATAYITTHSNVLIDQFSGDKDAQILHVQSNGGEATCRAVSTYVERRGIIEDLDVRASDLLQSNVVIWVEGPSDRVYINHFINLLSGGVLREGSHYQCVFYGGKLLAHLDASALDLESKKLLDILRVNRNAIVVMDSDRRSDESSINSTKQRIIDEITSIGGVPWVSHGREIENYIPPTSFSKFNTLLNREIGKHEEIEMYLGKLIGEEAWKSDFVSKYVFSEKIVEYIDLADLSSQHDLVAAIGDLMGAIRRWNGISLNPV